MTLMRAAHLLAPGAVARLPIVDRIAAVKVPVTFVCNLSSVQACLPFSMILQTAITIGWIRKAASIQFEN